MRTLVLLNRNAGAGQAAGNWRGLAAKLANVLGAKPAVYDETCDWRKRIEEASSHGPCLVTAAGGDGTVHRVANLVLTLPLELRSRTVLGALGFGSSNDFHKPPGEHSRFLGIPARCWPGHTVQQSILEVSYLDPSGLWHDAYAVMSASIGMVALGNDLFNRRWGPVGACRALGTSAGIWCASLAGVWRQKGISVDLRVDGRLVYGGTTCLLGFYVNRHIGGRLSYPAPTVRSPEGESPRPPFGGHLDGGAPRMGISLLSDVSVGRRLFLLGRAATEALPGPPQTLLWWAHTAECLVHQPTLLEMDGEVVHAREVRVHLVPKVLRVCA
jgi:hypothetical protein